jgi:L-amino acid N-acyltransferase YncA
MIATDWPAVRSIYELGIATGNATFETDAPEWNEWNESHLANYRLVAVADNKVLGWAASSPVSDRCVYGGVAENSVYIDPAWKGRGVGRALLEAMNVSAEKPDCGRFRQAYSLRTPPALVSTNASGSVRSAVANASANSTGYGAIPCSSSDGASSSAAHRFGEQRRQMAKRPSSLAAVRVLDDQATR